MARTVTLGSMRRNLCGIIRDARDQVRTVQHWNKISPRSKPLDAEPERVILARAPQARAALDRGDMSEFDRLTSFLAAYAKRVSKEKC